MNTIEKPVEIDQVSCAMCLKEVPMTEATVPEAADYFVHFCGLDCYEQWKNKKETSEQLSLPASDNLTTD
jgi:hypothetical protein